MHELTLESNSVEICTVCHIPNDVQIGHRGKERELAGIERGNYSRECDKDSKNLAPDCDKKAAVVLTVAGNRDLQGISGV